MIGILVCKESQQAWPSQPGSRENEAAGQGEGLNEEKIG
jgi:hypothetical protein